MPLFICENCGAIENTSLGHYWSRNHIKFKDSSMNGKALCSECIPLEFEDGSKAGKGKWHNHFPKEKFDSTIHKSEDYLNIT
jgi:hypothetical protein